MRTRYATLGQGIQPLDLRWLQKNRGRSFGRSRSGVSGLSRTMKTQHATKSQADQHADAASTHDSAANSPIARRVPDCTLLHPRTGRPIDPNWTPLDVTTVAWFFNKSTWWVTAIAKHRATPFSGKYTTLAKVSAWLDLHPDFSAARYHRNRAYDLAVERQFNARIVAITSSQRTQKE